MRLLISFLACHLLLSCSASITNAEDGSVSHADTIVDISQPEDTILINALVTPEISYNSTKQSVKNAIAQGKHSGADFENYLIHHIVPYWYGTEWDFNGYTAIPNEGVIACGYFVSTTLLHMGVNIDRYKLAQQAGLLEAKSLALGDEHYETIWGIDNLEKVLKERYKDGVYFVGLDNHVGFLYIKYGTPYFLHSNYIEDGVMMEPALDAPAFQSNIYVIAELSTNEDFLAKWRKGERFKVHLE
ncbi:MAG: hypothetical protein QNK23_05470 [Crocinitomicaceae bacterium]|nr:hypothetical protein [Crocinitomicaceae bacterium]